ncbi:MAG: sigma-E processing peptidase SpoIIGA [Clostridium sp.]
MELYVDMIILENVCIVFFLLSITFKIMNVNIGVKRILISSLIGGIYTLVMIIPEIRVLSIIPIQILVVAIMILICIQIKKVLVIIKGIVIFLLSSFLLSGVCFGLSLMQNEFNLSSPYTITNYSIKYTIFAVIGLYFISMRIMSIIKDRMIVTNFIYDIEIIHNNKICELKAFLDTGNELREPITNLPCIIIEKEKVGKLFEENENTYHIPYSAIGYNGTLVGVKVNKVRINREKGKYTEITAIICQCNNTLSKEGDYNALLSRGVI